MCHSGTKSGYSSTIEFLDRKDGKINLEISCPNPKDFTVLSAEVSEQVLVEALSC